MYRERTNVERRYLALCVQFAPRVCRVYSALVARYSCTVGVVPLGVRETTRHVTFSTQLIGSLEKTSGQKSAGRFILRKVLLLLTFHCMPTERAHEVQTENIRSSKERFCTEKGNIVGKKLIPRVLEG